MKAYPQIFSIESAARSAGFSSNDVSKTKTTRVIKMLREHGPADVAAQQRKIGYSRGRSFLVALLTGLVEFVGGAVLGVVAVAFSEALLPWGMGFAAGAMLFVISNEIIPESHLEGQGLAGTVGVIVGFLVMMILDTAFA